ncbi:aspartokinase I / homoserine dehydrogenase I [Buchnera aphidicola (Cinara tujafilina)]|uniref:Bifunctional aspartokinase/homoserine dehydrogenase n=1 Tax=Buchnera aphidicola (Cinara tujafilina) TaxID=261317 RepID=F7WZ66_9GAMM|nr:bifunctional aspartate kinase/homoserine dehydrogenase I [Buchnera aphidicola]AEH39720.1 aspartokinase I / homoserine dehydrogenase I [Buchnera aphidicola (Cinara tujafilina)]
MKTLKFGGTSLETAKKFLQVSSIIINSSKKTKVSVVLSAPAKITNYLIVAINDSIQQKKNHKKNIDTIKKYFLNLLLNICKIQLNFQKKIIDFIDIQSNKLKNILKSINILKQCPENIQATIMCIGEKFSIKIMHQLLISKQYHVTTLNPRKIFLSTNESYLNATIDLHESKKRIEKIKIPEKNIILMPGFIAGNYTNELVLLGRNGSDYSAAALAVCMNAKICEIWTDVDGMYTSDPNIVTNAQLLKNLSYKEAMELAFFGATVIHPRTLFPLKKYNIPCLIKNTCNPAQKGTLITQNLKENKKKEIKGITFLNNLSILNISTLNNVHILNYCSRIFSCMSLKNINILFSIYSSSQNKISICIEKNEIKKSLIQLEKTFFLEIKNNILKPIKILNNLCAITIVGEHLKNNYTSIFKKIFKVLKNTNNKIVSTVCNPSNISISLILYNQYISEFLKVLHENIIHKKKIINVFLLGIGGVGTNLIHKIFNQTKTLNDIGIKINLVVTTNSKKYLIHKQNTNFENWKIHFKNQKKNFCLDKILKIPKKENLINPVLIDCTASQKIADQYINIIKNGFHIITANKKSNSSSSSQYKKIRSNALKYNKKFFYETHVGAGLPVIQNLQNLLRTGDKLISFQGILSGSMSFIFGKLDKGMSLSKATEEAKILGFTEPDPRDDLSGIDIARKLLILARETGYQLELSDIKIEKILPDNFEKIKDIKLVMSRLKELDASFNLRFQKAKKRKKVLRFVGTIKNTGECNVKIIAVSQKNPLYNIKNGENILIFHTKYYHPIPLILRGYGAGNNVTASGIFSDLLRTIS